MKPFLLEIDWNFFQRVYFHQKVADYILFGGIILVTLLLKKPVAALLARASSNIASRYSYMKHRDTIGDMLFKPMERLLQTILYFVATEQLSNILDSVNFHRPLSKAGHTLNLGDATDHIFLLLFIIFFTQFVTRFIDFIYYLRVGKAQEERNLAQQQMLPLIKEMSKLLTWTLSAFWIMGAVFHVNIPALITGLGIGGVAIALAGKETVENFFAAFTILSDKPFIVGDVIKLGDTEGTVERIGFRSTRLRNTDGSAYIIPNQKLVSQNLTNLSMRDNRVVKIMANIRYGISHDELQKLITALKTAISQFAPVKEPVDINIENFDKETFLLNISYHLPHPLPEGLTLLALKRDVNMKVYEIITASASLGTPENAG